MSAVQALVASLLVAGGTPEWAQGRILLLEEPSASTIMGRLRVELRALGFDVILGPAPAGDPADAELAAQAVAVGALAGVRVRPAGDGVEVWVLDHRTHALAMREEVLRGEDGADQELVALRAVELLRASLLEVREPTPALRGSDAPRPPSEVPAAEPRAPPLTPPSPGSAPAKGQAAPPPAHAGPAWTVNAALGGELSAGGVPPALQARLAGDLYLPRGWSVGLRAVLPTWATVLRSGGGSAAISTALFLASASVDLIAPSSPLGLRAGIDAGAAWVHATGTGAEGFVGERVDEGLAVGGAHLLALHGLGAGFSLFAEADVLVGQPQLLFQLAGLQVASYGVPIGIVLVGVQFQG